MLTKDLIPGSFYKLESKFFLLKNNTISGAKVFREEDLFLLIDVINKSRLNLNPVLLLGPDGRTYRTTRAEFNTFFSLIKE